VAARRLSAKCGGDRKLATRELIKATQEYIGKNIR
jgi:hypothetical protein